MAKLGALSAIGIAAMLSACGGSPAGEGGATASTSGGAANVLDACAILDKAVVAQSLGGTVQSTELSAVHDGKSGEDRFSQCTYKFGDGLEMLVFGAGESSNGAKDTIADMTARFREQMQITKVPTVDVAGLGKAALWNEELHALWVLPADGRYYGFTLYKVGQPDQKAAAIALARKFGL